MAMQHRRAVAPGRRFTHDGVRWSVREVDAPAIPARDRARCLIFESDQAVRRVFGFPRDWVELRDEDLWAVSLGR